MKSLSAVATVLILCAGAFFKINRVVQVINQDNSQSAYEQSGDDGFGNYQSGGSTPTSSGVQSNPYIK